MPCPVALQAGAYDVGLAAARGKQAFSAAAPANAARMTALPATGVNQDAYNSTASAATNIANARHPAIEIFKLTISKSLLPAISKGEGVENARRRAPHFS